MGLRGRATAEEEVGQEHGNTGARQVDSEHPTPICLDQKTSDDGANRETDGIQRKEARLLYVICVQ